MPVLRVQIAQVEYERRMEADVLAWSEAALVWVPRRDGNEPLRVENEPYIMPQACRFLSSPLSTPLSSEKIVIVKNCSGSVATTHFQVANFEKFQITESANLR